MKCPHCLKEIGKSNIEVRLENRLNIIVEYLELTGPLLKVTSQYQIYKSLKESSNYFNSNKTFKRDLEILEKKGIIKLKRVFNKPKGLKTIIELIKSHNGD